jgi:excisionase family DNA binding protein
MKTDHDKYLSQLLALFNKQLIKIYKKELHEMNRDWVIDKLISTVENKIISLYQGYSGNVLAKNLFKKEIINLFENNQKRFRNNYVSKTIPEIKLLQDFYKNHNIDYDSNFIKINNDFIWVKLYAKYCAYNMFIDFLRKEKNITEDTDDKMKKTSDNISTSQENKTKELLTIDQVSKLLKLAKQTVYGMTSKGKIPFCKKGKILYFDEDEILNWVKEGRKKTMKEIDAEAEAIVRKNQ